MTPDPIVTIHPSVKGLPPQHPNFTMAVPRHGGVYYMRDSVMLLALNGQVASFHFVVALLHQQAHALAMVEAEGSA